jgi:hypothetical protein
MTLRAVHHSGFLVIRVKTKQGCAAGPFGRGFVLAVEGGLLLLPGSPERWTIAKYHVGSGEKTMIERYKTKACYIF